jgi:hypothetical protein
VLGGTRLARINTYLTQTSRTGGFRWQIAGAEMLQEDQRSYNPLHELDNVLWLHPALGDQMREAQSGEVAKTLTPVTACLNGI